MDYHYTFAAFYGGAREFLVLDDVTDEPSVNSSFAELKNWIRNIKQHASDNVEKILLGTNPQAKPYGDSSVLYLNEELGKSVLDLVKNIMDIDFSLKLSGHVQFSSNSNVALHDLLSIASEFTLTFFVCDLILSVESCLLFHFSRFDNEVLTQSCRLAPSKSPEKNRLKPSPNKQNTIEKLGRKPSTR
ncbi:hypothetical protein Bca4012_097380 [Brassica carinata]